MNAYELADTLQETEPYYSTDYKLFDNAAAMLRQQADRILELDVNLKAQIRLAYDQADRIAELEKAFSDVYKEYKEYYTHPHSEESVKAKTEDEPDWKKMYWWMHELNHKHWSELYALKTHLAKTLTDEEIYKIAMEVQTGFLPQDDTLAFARAILRKAQEK